MATCARHLLLAGCSPPPSTPPPTTTTSADEKGRGAEESPGVTLTDGTGVVRDFKCWRPLDEVAPVTDQNHHTDVEGIPALAEWARQVPIESMGWR